MLKKRRYLWLIILAIFPLILTCGGGGGGGGTASTPSSGGTTPAPATTEASANIGPSGGVVEVTNPASSLYKVKVEIPEGALDSEKTIAIKTVSIEPPLSSATKKVSQTIYLEPAGQIFSEMVSLTIPYNIAGVNDENTLQIYEYNGLSWEGVTFGKRDTNSNTVTAFTFHFSEYAVLEATGSASKNFKPDLNGFAIKNPGPFCSGMVTYAKWFFETGKCSLSKAYESATAEKVADSASVKILGYNIQPIDKVKKALEETSDKEIAEQLIANLQAGNLPVLLIAQYGENNQLLPIWHYVLVYAYDGAKFFLYDPDKPKEQKTIGYGGEYLDDYFPLILGIKAVDYLVATSQLYHPDRMEDVFKSFPFYVAGSWHYETEANITCTIDGETETQNPSQSGTLTLNQSGSSVNWVIPNSEYSRTGTVTADEIRVSGIFAVPLVEGVQISQNVYTAEGKVCDDKIVLNGEGFASGTYEGLSFTCSGTDRTVFTRSSVSPEVGGTVSTSKAAPLMFFNRALEVFTGLLP